MFIFYKKKLQIFIVNKRNTVRVLQVERAAFSKNSPKITDVPNSRLFFYEFFFLNTNIENCHPKNVFFYINRKWQICYNIFQRGNISPSFVPNLTISTAHHFHGISSPYILKLL